MRRGGRGRPVGDELSSVCEGFKRGSVGVLGQTGTEVNRVRPGSRDGLKGRNRLEGRDILEGWDRLGSRDRF